jgi:endonuclease YncB( thermonuclease family)
MRSSWRWLFGIGQPLKIGLVVQIVLLVLLQLPAGALAAELRQVRTGSVLQVGDSNRTYSVRLACIAVDDAQQQEAVSWLRQAVARGSRVNLRPFGEQDGELVARVTSLPRGQRPGQDLGAGLVAAGLATPLLDHAADPACLALS